MIEICDTDGIVTTGTHFQNQRCLIRVNYRCLSQKTKKNLNCKNPKFYQLFKIPLENFEKDDHF